MASPAHEALFESWRLRVDAALESALPSTDDAPQRLHAAMRHAALLGGKRMRPLLVYATGTAFAADVAALDAADVAALDAPAAAVELIHAYSLVHDDLPAMDDDALRRGQPTVHIAFDEATAILAGDALQSLAFELLADAPCPDDARVAMLRELSVAAGVRGMCGGQALDIDATGERKRGQSEVSRRRSSAHAEGRREIHSDPFFSEIHSDPFFSLERLHALKTGALLRAAVRLGAITAGADTGTRAHLDTFADAMGLAFQIRDDLLDVEGDSATLGKTPGKDAEQDKATFPALIGVQASHERLRTLSQAMEQALADFGDGAEPLRALARLAVERDR